MWRAVLGLVCAVVAAVLPAPALAQVGNGQLAVVLGDRIVAVNPDGTGLRPLYSPAGGPISGPAWSPDGNALAFSYAGRITVLDVATKEAAWLTDPGSGASDVDPAWLADGTIGFRRVSRGAAGIVKQERVSVTRGGAVLPARSLEVDLSAFAFARDLETYASRVGPVLSRSGDDLHLSSNASDTPAWSPNRTELAYIELGSTQPMYPYTAGLRVVKVVGGSANRAVAPLPASAPRWAPDGSRLVFTSEGRVLTASAGGEQAPVAVPNVSGATAVDWQPCTAATTVGCASVLPPVCSAATAQLTTQADQPVELPAGLCADPAGLALRVVLIKDGDHGSLTGSVYTPRPGFVGQDTVSYRVSNGTAMSDPVRVTIFVVRRPAAAGPAPSGAPPVAAAAPFLSLRLKPALDRRRSILARLSCDQACSFRVRLEGKLRGRKKAIKGATVGRSLAAGRLLALRLKLPAKPAGRLKTVSITGTVRGANGSARPVKLSVTVRR